MELNYGYAIEEAQTPKEVHTVITSMMDKLELLDVLEGDGDMPYKDMAERIYEEAETFYSEEHWSDINGVVYALELAHRRIQDLLKS